MTFSEFAATPETTDFMIAFDIHDEDDWIEMTTDGDDLDSIRFSAFDA